MNIDFFPSEELIRLAETGDVRAAAELDQNGFLLKPAETPSQYAGRIRAMRKKHDSFFQHFDQNGNCEVYPGLIVNRNHAIPDEIIAEAGIVTEKKYGFNIRWAPGFFPEHELGILWGGCAVSDSASDSIPVFIIRKNFKNSSRWFIYSRKELLSHELCHTARMPLHDKQLEEHFAYAVSGSPLRRAVGNCFQTDLDAILFLLPVMILLLVQILINLCGLSLIPAAPFWILAFLWPVFLLTRNAVQTGRFRTAKKNLQSAGFPNPDAVLFRCLSSEINLFADMSPESIRADLDARAETEFRWKVILSRFG